MRQCYFMAVEAHIFTRHKTKRRRVAKNGNVHYHSIYVSQMSQNSEDKKLRLFCSSSDNLNSPSTDNCPSTITKYFLVFPPSQKKRRHWLGCLVG